MHLKGNEILSVRLLPSYGTAGIPLAGEMEGGTSKYHGKDRTETM